MSKPFLKWVGGKRQLLEELRKDVPRAFLDRASDAGTYYEPFVGGGALFFDLAPKRAVLADMNPHLVATYQAIRDDVERVIGLLAAKPDDKGFYMLERGRVPSEPSAIAAWFLYLNRAGFNGLYRVNRKGGFNVPYGGRPGHPRTLCHPDVLRDASRALQGVEIRHGSFETTVASAKRGDFVYFDPPYVPVSTPASSSPSFVGYTSDGFGDKEQERLRDVALELAERGVSVLLSNACADRVLELYRPERVELRTVAAQRMVNSKASGRARGAAVEVILRALPIVRPTASAPQKEATP